MATGTCLPQQAPFQVYLLNASVNNVVTFVITVVGAIRYKEIHSAPVCSLFIFM